MLEQRIEQDIKASMLAGDAQRTLTLRTVKSVLLSAKVAAGTRDTGLSDEEVVSLLAKEAKKRQESADFYIQGGATDRADKELSEKAIIESYLPAQLSEAELITLIETAIANSDEHGPAAMGKLIGAVKQQAGATADGALIARLVKERI